MRCMVRNRTKFYYASYAGKSEITDEYGNKTGEYSVTYDNPIMCLGNVSAAKGEMQSRQFGESEVYDRVIVLDDPNTLITEHSILWVDSLPIIEADGSTETPHDYVVKKVARSLNNVSIAISKVIVK